MTKKQTKLELTWIGKDQTPRLEPRILIEDPEKSYHAAHRVNEDEHRKTAPAAPTLLAIGEMSETGGEQ